MQYSMTTSNTSFTMDIPACIWIPSAAAGDDCWRSARSLLDDEMTVCSSIKKTNAHHRAGVIRLSVEIPRRCKANSRSPAASSDAPMKLPNRKGSRDTITSEASCAEAATTMNASFVVSSKRRHQGGQRPKRSSLTCPVPCIQRALTCPKQKESVENDRPPRMPRRNST